MSERKKIVLSIFLAIVLRFVLVPFFNHGDVENHVVWGIWAKEFGLKGYYDFLNFFNYARPNQPPLTILLYGGMRHVYELLFASFWFLNIKIPAFPSLFIKIFEEVGYIWVLKLPSILADLLLGYLVYLVAKKEKIAKPILLMNLFLFNPVSWYNSVVWGQTDSVMTLLGFLSVIAFYYRKYFWGAILFALALMFKATLIIFAPVLGVIILKRKLRFRKTLAVAGLFLATVFLVSEPFAVGSVFPWIYDLYTKKIITGELPLVSANAFNFWWIIFSGKTVPDSEKFGGMAFFSWGILIFGIFAFAMVAKLHKKLNLERLLAALVIIIFSAFLFLTRMHERYIYPVFVPLILLAGKNKRILVLFIALSILHLMNMYNGWWVPKIPMLISLVSFQFVQSAIGLAYIFGFTWFLLKK